jgi:hypothetical protein
MTAMPSQGLPDGFHIKALNSGKVEFRLVSAGKEVAVGLLTAKQLSVLVANFLNAAHSSLACTRFG